MNVCLLDGPAEADAPFVASEFVVKWATEPWERREAHALRRATFCHEQGIFVGDDLDAIDARAQLIVAVSVVAGEHDQVVGTVRIHRDADASLPNVWWGSRLAVHPSFRRIGRIGAGLIRMAVSSAHADGCDRFLAHVQSQNVPMFEKLHWRSFGEVSIHGRPHHHMQADLAHYPPRADGAMGFVLVTSPSLSKTSSPSGRDTPTTPSPSGRSTLTTPSASGRGAPTTASASGRGAPTTPSASGRGAPTTPSPSGRGLG